MRKVKLVDLEFKERTYIKNNNNGRWVYGYINEISKGVGYVQLKGLFFYVKGKRGYSTYRIGGGIFEDKEVYVYSKKEWENLKEVKETLPNIILEKLR